MLLIMAWLFWLWYENENEGRRQHVDTKDSSMKDATAHVLNGAKTHYVALHEENTESREKSKDAEQNMFHEKNTPITEDVIDISIVNFDESENTFDYHDELTKSDNFVEEEDIIPIVENNNYNSIENDYLEVENNDELSTRSITLNTNSVKNSNSKIQNVTLASAQNMEETTQTNSHVKINVKVVNPTKLTLKNEVTPGRIHSIVVKDNDSNTSNVRSLSPRLRIHSNNSVAGRHGKDEHHS